MAERVINYNDVIARSDHWPIDVISGLSLVGQFFDNPCHWSVIEPIFLVLKRNGYLKPSRIPYKGTRVRLALNPEDILMIIESNKFVNQTNAKNNRYELLFKHLDQIGFSKKEQ